jgi:hypothetical protein
MSAKSEIEQCIGRNECPVCHLARTGLVAPRRALQEHLKRSKDPAHVMWRERHYKYYFQHGGKMTERTVSVQDIINSVHYIYGKEWAHKCEEALCVV